MIYIWNTFRSKHYHFFLAVDGDEVWRNGVDRGHALAMRLLVRGDIRAQEVAVGLVALVHTQPPLAARVVWRHTGVINVI